METESTLGEIRNLLAGLRCPSLGLLYWPDKTPVRVTTALAGGPGGLHYVLAVEVNRRVGSAHQNPGCSVEVQG